MNRPDKTVYGAIRAQRAYSRAERVRQGYKEAGFDVDPDGKLVRRLYDAIVEELARGARRVATACPECVEKLDFDEWGTSCPHHNKVHELIIALEPATNFPEVRDLDLDNEYPVLSDGLKELLKEGNT